MLTWDHGDAAVFGSIAYSTGYKLNSKDQIGRRGHTTGPEVVSLLASKDRHTRWPCRIAGWQTRLSREAMQPQSCGRRNADASTTKVSKARNRWTHSRGFLRTRSRSSQRFMEALSAGLISEGLVRQCADVSRQQAKRHGCHLSLTGTSGNARHNGTPIRTICTHTTGTGSRCMALANPKIVVLMRLISAVGHSGQTIPSVSHRLVADIKNPQLSCMTSVTYIGWAVRFVNRKLKEICCPGKRIFTSVDDPADAALYSTE